MKRKKKYFSNLRDIKHWIGYILSTVGIIYVFHLIGVHALHTPWYHAVILFLLIVLIDTIKHPLKLQ